MLPLVRMGDPLRPFGGEVLEGHYEAFGKPVACVDDKARCNLHGLTHIVEGASGSTMDGKPVAPVVVSWSAPWRSVQWLSHHEPRA
jgi:uncharacterized Zn-binding protein involved in type VI secretion